MQQALGATSVLVEYMVAEERSYATVVSRADMKMVPLAVGRARLRQQVRHLLEPFAQLRSGQVDLARVGFDSQAAFTLYQEIFAPVRPYLGQASEILIVPDDVLHFLPFDHACGARAGEGCQVVRVLHGEYEDTAFLLRRYTMSYLSSSAQLPRARRRGSAGGRGRSACSPWPILQRESWRLRPHRKIH